MTGPDRPQRTGDPFAALGLAPRADLTDDEVRAAWRRIAAATHPDRQDGGDPQRFAVAAAAYTALRTGFGRSEALADLSAGPASGAGPGRRRSVTPWFSGFHAGRAARLATRIQGGRPRRLALRVLATIAASAAAVAAAGFHPAAPALVTGAVTWLACTARRDLAPPG
jgi:curved DNA-binding protein CbpA